MDKYLKDYISRLEAAATTCANEDIDNSTTEHALAAIKTIVSKSSDTVKVFTTSFRFDFWKNLEKDIEGFLTSKTNATFEVVSILPPSFPSACLLRKLSSKFCKQFKAIHLLGVSKENADNAYNFVTGDSSFSRFELSDGDASKGIVTAIINFGNKDRVSTYNGHFESFKNGAHKVI